MGVTPFGGYGLNISILLVGIMLAIGGIVLGLGYALNDRRLKEFGRNEILQSIINGALVGGFLILFIRGGIVDSLINSTVLANGTRLSCSTFLQDNAAICFAYEYLVGPAPYYFMGSNHYSILTSSTLLILALSALYAVLGLLKLFLSPLLAEIQSIIQLLGAASISATTQASVLAFIAASALTMILPLGLMLRTFYPTRSMGSFLIALTIGLYIVFPLTYLLNATIANNYSEVTNQSTVTTLVANVSAVSGSASSYIKQHTNSTDISTMLGNAWNGLVNGTVNLLTGFFNSVAYFILCAFILPIFSLMLTGISIRELSRLLGSETFFGKFSLL